MALVASCEKCGFVMSKYEKKCPKCGVIARRPSLTKKLVAGGLSLVALIAVFGGEKTVSEKEPLKTSPPPLEENKPAAGMSSAEHLARAKKAMSVWRPHKNPAKAEWGDLNEAATHLDAIKESAPEYAEAKEMSAVLKARQNEVNMALLDVAAKESTRRRTEIAKEMELRFLDNGLDVHVSVTGKDQSTLRLKYVLMTRPFAHKFINTKEQISLLQLAGFKRVEFFDGHREEWSYDM